MKRMSQNAHRLQAESRCKQAEKPAAQTAHLVFCRHISQRFEKPKELNFANARVDI
jgi:hypothetical protein